MWIRGVRLTEFIDRSRKGTYQGHAYNGANLTSIVELPNHVPQQFNAWVDKEVAALVNKGCIARWSEVADVSTHPKPNVTLPVGIEPTKPRSRKGTYQGHAYNGADLTPIVELPNHVPQEFDAWVDKEVAALVNKGCIARWSEGADVSTHPKPNVTLPVGIEPTKPRFICDARYLNLMCKHSEFKMDGVGKVAQCSWQGAHQISMDHKSGFHNVPLHPDSWTYFGICWKGVYYVWTVLCFGWCESPYIYHTLSSAVAQYLRHLDVPITTWLDDFWMSNFQATKTQSPAQQREAAREVPSLALTVFYQCGYFMSIIKCVLEPTTRLVFLGIICDTEARRFEVPEGKLLKLEVILTAAITSGWISFVDLERLAGKCTSMSVAVPPASLYTHHMYKHIAKFRRTGGRVKAAMIAVQKSRGLSDELHTWREVRHRMNGASWYDATHHSIKLTGATDASSSGWGGIVRGPFKSFSVFKASADFPAEWIDVHISVKETFALHEVLRLLVAQHPDHLRGTTLVVDVDNTTMFHAFRKGRAKNEQMHDLIKSLFWLQVDSDFTIKLKWVCSADNKDADNLTRPGAVEHVRLEQRCFGHLWEEWGGFDMDLMTTGTSVQWIPGGGQDRNRALPFYSRYHTDSTAGVDVLGQDVNHMPGSANACFGFCFPPPQMIAVVLQHMQDCKARAVVVVPDDRQSWFPLLAAATVRSVPVAAKGGAGTFFRMHHQKGRESFVFRQWGMRAVEVDFRQE